MSPYIETIQLLDGKLNNLIYHQERFQRTRLSELGLETHPRLEDVIVIPGGLEKGLFKCRVLYGKEINSIEYEPYVPRSIGSLKLVQGDFVSYAFKYRKRDALEELFQQRGGCDDILIVRKGCITDSFYANVVFWDGKTWTTPDTPLLPGTMRASLMKAGIIREVRITPDSLQQFQKLRLINAMNELQAAPEITIECIY